MKYAPSSSQSVNPPYHLGIMCETTCIHPKLDVKLYQILNYCPGCPIVPLGRLLLRGTFATTAWDLAFGRAKTALEALQVEKGRRALAL